jgi:hypothetical protein
MESDDARVPAAEDILGQAIDALKERRSVFYNEADFQHSLAWMIQLAHPDAALRFEVPLHGGGRLDLFINVGGLRIAVELKYPRARFTAEVASEPLPFARANPDAVDDTRHASIRDLERLEGLVRDGVADIGCLLLLTNNAEFWRTPAAPTSALDAAFRLHDGAALTGQLDWGTGGREKASVSLAGVYTAGSRDYSWLETCAGRSRRGWRTNLLMRAERRPAHQGRAA